MLSRNKRLVVCSDGTWNDPEDEDVTNVVKTARAVSPVDESGVQQVVFYDWGVGTGGVADRLEGGVSGEGLDKNIQDIYRFLVHNYVPGDEIFLFGFSRGAYTARSAVGLIRNAGILEKQHSDLIPRAYSLYRSKSKPDTPSAREFRRRYSRETRIRLIGVWDTVGALGIPVSFLQRFNKDEYSFHDTTLSRIIDYACHAVAIDERREDFKPTLWQVQPSDNQTVEQAWFVGVHSDVGGGYKEHGLSDITLMWVLEKAREAGLALDADYLSNRVTPDPYDKRHHSRKHIFHLRGKYLRPIGMLGEHFEEVHSSVRDRFNADAGYRPKNLVTYLNQHRLSGWNC